eukprot:g16548.t1
MVFHIPGRLLMETQSSELEGLLGDIALCAVLGVRPVLVPSLSQRVWARLSAECKEFEVKEDPDALEALCNASFESAEMVARLLKQEAGMLFALAVPGDVSTLKDALEEGFARCCKTGAQKLELRAGCTLEDCEARSIEVQDLFLRVAAKPTGNFETNKSLSVFASSQLVSAAPQRAASGWQSSPLLGRVTGIDSAQILQRLQEDRTISLTKRVARSPAKEQVVCVLPVAAGPLRGDGRLHYIPSEELAAQVAEQLKAAKLIFFTRGQRIVDTAHGNVPRHVCCPKYGAVKRLSCKAIPTMQLGEASRLLEHAKTSSTFMDKDESKEVVKYLQWLIQALRSGTRRGHLIDPQRGALLQELYTTDGSGTMISLDLYDGIRMAGSGDVSGILDLIEPLEEEMRKEAVKSFKPPTVWMPTLDLKKLFMHKVNLHRNSNTTIFEQTRNAFEYEDPRAWGANWTGLFFTVNFTNEKGVDSFGLRKEWLSLVLQSIVLPAGHSDKTGLQCVSSGKCGDEGTPQYLLKALPSGELVPISVEEVETSEQTGRIGSMLKFAYDAYDLAYERVLGEKEKLPYAARMRFQFLGKWLARAHIVTDLGFAPMGLHRVIYQSLVAGYVVTPQTPSFYSEEDTIPACEKLAAIWRRRSPQELQSYGWLSCDEVKDHTGKYTQASCYKPIFRDEMMWNALYLAWGSLAPDGAKADDTVPFSAARDFTERRCEQSWKAFEEPVKYIVQGFREVIPSTSGLWKLLDGKWQKLSHLIEGSSEVNVDEMLKAVSWTCSSEEEAVIIEVLHDLQKQGQDLPPRFEDAPGKAELGCFVVSPLCRGKGHGAVLLSYIERVATLLGVRQLFLLTTQTMQWFVERGFQNASLDDLPPSKREGYDLGRSSKVFIKNVSDLPSELQQRFTFVEVDALD